MSWLARLVERRAPAASQAYAPVSRSAADPADPELAGQAAEAHTELAAAPLAQHTPSPPRGMPEQHTPPRRPRSLEPAQRTEPTESAALAPVLAPTSSAPSTRARTHDVATEPSLQAKSAPHASRADAKPVQSQLVHASARKLRESLAHPATHEAQTEQRDESVTHAPRVLDEAPVRQRTADSAARQLEQTRDPRTQALVPNPVPMVAPVKVEQSEPTLSIGRIVVEVAPAAPQPKRAAAKTPWPRRSATPASTTGRPRASRLRFCLGVS